MIKVVINFIMIKIIIIPYPSQLLLPYIKKFKIFSDEIFILNLNPFILWTILLYI